MSKGDLSARAEVRGSFEAQHLAESFNVLVQELKSLGLDVKLHEEGDKKSSKRLGAGEKDFVVQ